MQVAFTRLPFVHGVMVSQLVASSNAQPHAAELVILPPGNSVLPTVVPLVKALVTPHTRVHKTLWQQRVRNLVLTIRTSVRTRALAEINARLPWLGDGKLPIMMPITTLT
jgi:hypothetical protein